MVIIVTLFLDLASLCSNMISRVASLLLILGHTYSPTKFVTLDCLPSVKSSIKIQLEIDGPGMCFFDNLVLRVSPQTFAPTTPSESPTSNPTTPSESPTSNPTTPAPTSNPATSAPSEPPSLNPTAKPTQNPTANPTVNPSAHPSAHPTANPSSFPTQMPSRNPFRRGGEGEASEESPQSSMPPAPPQLNAQPNTNPLDTVLVVLWILSALIGVGIAVGICKLCCHFSSKRRRASKDLHHIEPVENGGDKHKVGIIKHNVDQSMKNALSKVPLDLLVTKTSGANDKVLHESEGKGDNKVEMHESEGKGNNKVEMEEYATKQTRTLTATVRGDAIDEA
eukprot:227806_1